MSETYTLTYQDHAYDVKVERQGDTLVITHGEDRYAVEVTKQHISAPPAPPAPVSTPTPTKAASPPPSAVRGSGNSGTVAPITGVIKSIHVSVGETITDGQLLITMEAMKMDIQVTATSGGSVKEILVAVGDSVQQQAPLVTCT